MTIDTHVRDMMNIGAASLNRELLSEYGVLAVTIAGARKCGKTSLLEATAERFGDDLRIGMIVSGVGADRDAERLAAACDHVTKLESIAINAGLVRESLEGMDLSHLDVLLIERSSSHDPAGHAYDDLGQNLSVGMVSLSGGGTKAPEALMRFKRLDLLLLTKIDFAPILPSELLAFHEAVAITGAAAPIVEVSMNTGLGLNRWCAWLQSHAHAVAPRPVHGSKG